MIIHSGKSYLLINILVLLSVAQLASTASSEHIVKVDISKIVNRFIPDFTLGAAIDGHEKGDIELIYTPDNIKAMKSAGFKPLSYRLRTELGIETWHWNPTGDWSDQAHKQGYWISNPNPGKPIIKSNGYFLPRRGNTHDQAGNYGYSRIDDGDETTYWKSNPYLDKPFSKTHHPQWVAVFLDKSETINTIRIHWAVPYATKYSIDYWYDGHYNDTQGIDTTIFNEGAWKAFPNRKVIHGSGGIETIKLSPNKVQFIRINLLSSSHTPQVKSSDIRDSRGYAIREIEAGYTNNKGKFHNYVKYGTNKETQTTIYVSSTDPWHRSTDIDPNIEQPGFDLVFNNGINQGLPMMIPLGLMFDTPENALNALKYLKARGYPYDKVELGEEPDGEYFIPEDYAELYSQWSEAIHAWEPSLKTGGPSYQTMVMQERAWPDKYGNKSWTNRFINYLKNNNHIKYFNFFTTECYFYDDVAAPPSPKLRRMPGYVSEAVTRWKLEGVPSNIPWYVTEYGYSPYAGTPEVDLPGAILDTELVAHTLSLGFTGSYFYGLEPNTIFKEQPEYESWGNLALLRSDVERRVIAPFAAYYAERLLINRWSQPGLKPVVLYQAKSDIMDSFNQPIVSAYAAHRPDDKWSVLLFNKSENRSYNIKLRFTHSNVYFNNTVDIYQYSRKQYRWHPNKAKGYASPNLPPEHRAIDASNLDSINLPPYSITVVSGKISNGSGY